MNELKTKWTTFLAQYGINVSLYTRKKSIGLFLFSFFWNPIITHTRTWYTQYYDEVRDIGRDVAIKRTSDPKKGGELKKTQNDTHTHTHEIIIITDGSDPENVILYSII